MKNNPGYESSRSIYLNRYSVAAIFLIFAAQLFSFVDSVEGNSIISWDGFGYYFYLPMVFIYKTISMENLDLANQIFDKYEPSSALYQFTQVTDGRWIIRYTSGQAVLYLPFFLIGHLAALFTDYPADGFSKPYNLSVLFGGLIYHLLAWILIAKILLRFYAEKVVAATLLLLFFGTNAYYILAGNALTSQGSVFFLVALFIVLVDSYYRGKSAKKMLFAGCVFGLICINRPTDFITIIPAILWPAIIPGLSLKGELIKLFRNGKHLSFFLVPMLFFALLQFSYWKYAGGNWFINSYGNPAEGLDFLSPHTIPFLFSFKSGWLIYTPIMAIVLIYLIISSIRGNKLMQVVLLYVVLFIYLASSWSNWWYGGGFSQRAMVQAYSLLSLPLCGLVNFAFSNGRKVKFLLGSIFIGLLALSLWQNYQYKNGVLTADTVTAEYYFASFFDSKMDPSKKHLLAFSHFDIYIQPNYGLPNGYILDKTFTQNFPGGQADISSIEFLNGFKLRYNELTKNDYCFVLFSVVFEGPPPKSAGLVNSFDHDGTYGYQFRVAAENIVDTNTVDNEFTSTSVYLTPALRTVDDYMIAYLWNREKQAGKVKSMKLEVFIKPAQE